MTFIKSNPVILEVYRSDARNKAYFVIYDDKSLMISKSDFAKSLTIVENKTLKEARAMAISYYGSRKKMNALNVFWDVTRFNSLDEIKHVDSRKIIYVLPNKDMVI